MDSHFDEELKNVKRDILRLAAMVDDSITKSLDALKKRDTALARSVQEIDRDVDKLEMAIEETCIELIARHQPVGSDLRFLIGVIKMNNDLERMGDHAVNIATTINYLVDQPRMRPIIIWSMARNVKEMIKESVESFMTNDAERAQKVCEHDSVVDEMRNETIRVLLTHMLEEPEKISSAISYILVAKNLERIADLTTNICEDVIYIAQARVIKHHAEEKKKKDS
jgi:phosphate transport system protein